MLIMQNDSPFARFRRTNTVKNNCTKRKTSYFIENHLSSTVIYVERTDTTIPAVLIVNDKEGADEFLTFVYAEEDIQLGDYFTWKENNHFFVLEDVHIIKEVDYKKLKTLECNAQTTDGVWIHFKGNMRSFKDNTIRQNYEVNGLKPLIIAPLHDSLKINGYITIDNQVWHIVDADVDSIHGIGYYYVERDLNARDIEAEIEALEENGELDGPSVIYVDQGVTLISQYGFIRSSADIEILKRDANSVTFCPKSAGYISITIRQDNIEKTYNYEVKEL